MKEAKDIRELVLAAKTEGYGRGRRAFDPTLRSAVVEYVQRRRKEGVGLTRIADEVGLSEVTLDRWARASADGSREPANSQRAPRFKQLAVASAAGSFTVLGPAGVRIDGMRVDQLAELLRRLG